jgi:hypothetical protein
MNNYDKQAQDFLVTRNKLKEMNTIKEIAKNWSYYTIEDIPTKYQGRNELEKKKLPEWLSLIECEADYFYNCRTQTNYDKTETHYVDNWNHPYLLIKVNDLILTDSGMNKKTWFHPYHKFFNVSHQQMKTLKEMTTVKEPNHIGVFTKNKIMNFFEYYNDIIKVQWPILQKEIESKASKANDIIEQLQRIGAKEGYNMGNGIRNFHIDGFSISVTTSQDTGYVYSTCKWYGNIEDIIKLYDVHHTN